MVLTFILPVYILFSKVKLTCLALFLVSISGLTTTPVLIVERAGTKSFITLNTLLSKNLTSLIKADGVLNISSLSQNAS